MHAVFSFLAPVIFATHHPKRKFTMSDKPKAPHINKYLLMLTLLAAGTAGGGGIATGLTAHTHDEYVSKREMDTVVRHLERIEDRLIAIDGRLSD